MCFEDKAKNKQKKTKMERERPRQQNMNSVNPNLTRGANLPAMNIANQNRMPLVLNQRNSNPNANFAMPIFDEDNRNIEDVDEDINAEFNFQDMLNDPALHMNVYNPNVVENFNKEEEKLNSRADQKGGDLYLHRKRGIEVGKMGVDICYLTGSAKKKFRKFAFVLTEDGTYSIFCGKKRLMSYKTQTGMIFFLIFWLECNSYSLNTTLMTSDFTMWHVNQNILRPHSFNPFLRITGRHNFDEKCKDQSTYKIKALISDPSCEDHFLIFCRNAILKYNTKKKKIVKKIDPKIKDVVNKGGLRPGNSRFKTLKKAIYDSESGLLALAFDKMVKAHWAFILIIDVKATGWFFSKPKYMLKELDCGGGDNSIFQSFGDMLLTLDKKRILITSLEVVETNTRILIMNFEKKSKNFLKPIRTVSLPFPIIGRGRWLNNGFLVFKRSGGFFSMMKFCNDKIEGKAVCNEMYGKSNS